MSDDDEPQLSAHALAALQEFYQEQSAAAEIQNGGDGMPQENWQLSQFWYSDETAQKLAEEALSAVTKDGGSIACISCPTLYERLRQSKPDNTRAIILEYDKRFAKYGDDFLFYDYNEPAHIPNALHGTFDLVVADPPFLSEECLTKTAITIRLLAKEKVLLCTGAVMNDLASRLLQVTALDFRPQHSHNLSNEFRCYANYETKVIR